MKNLLLILEIITYGSFLWAGVFVFKNSEKGNKAIALTKILGIVTIAWNVTGLFQTEEFGPISFVGVALVIVSNVLFWNSIATIWKDPLSFAFASSRSSFVYRTGPFALVRHPFYLSYSLAWLGGCLITGSPILLLPAFLMTFLYIRAATGEEVALKKGPLASEYEEYCRQTGMFFPKVINK